MVNVRNATRLAWVSFVVALVLGATGSFLLLQSGSAEERIVPAAAANQSTHMLSEDLDPGDAMRREGLTKILYGMQYQDEPATVTAPIEKELAGLGGPDPSVSRPDGPDGPDEWAVQAEIDQQLCQRGQAAACDEQPIAERKAQP